MVREKIMRYIEDARKMHPEITDEMLCDNGAVFYMNSKNGTYFDWHTNHQLCYLYLFYKDTGQGFIKICIARRDVIFGYVYLEKGDGKPIRLEDRRLKKGDANYLFKLLLQEADHKRLFDKSLDVIDFKKTIG